jgi:hypothetical protein
VALALGEEVVVV